jgi:hypothetical protein
MIDFAIWIFIGVCWNLGFNYTFQPGEIFAKPGKWMDENLPEWMQKPLYSCPFCMSSAHGTIIFWLFMYGQFEWYYWILYCFCLPGFTVMTRE